MKNLIVLFTVLIFNLSIAQPPPPGISFYPYVDGNNDTYELFDINYYTDIYIKNIAQVVSAIDLSGYSIKLYPSELDRTNGSGVLQSFHTNVFPTFQQVYIKCSYVGPGPIYPQSGLDNLFDQSGLLVLPRLMDYDNDGILNYLEDSNGNLNLLDDNDDNDFIPNYADPSNNLANNTFVQNKFNIFPNPANTILNIETNFDFSENGTITIFDTLGKVVLETKLSKTISIAKITAGIYSVKIISNGTSSTQKLVVN